MNIIFRSTLFAFSLTVCSFTDSNADLPLESDVANNVDNYIRYGTLYSQRDDKKYSLVRMKQEGGYKALEKTVVKLEYIPLSPKYYNDFPWIGEHQTYVVQKAGDTTLYYLTIAEVLNINKSVNGQGVVLKQIAGPN